MTPAEIAKPYTRRKFHWSVSNTPAIVVAPSAAAARIALRRPAPAAKNKLEIANQSDTDWNDVELWVNQSYVVHLPLLKAHAEKVTSIPFQAIFNDKGRSFPTDGKTHIDKVEVYYGGTMYDVPKQLAD